MEANQAFARILGFRQPEEVIRRSIDRLFVDQGAAERWRVGLDSRETLENIETELERDDGSPVRVRMSARWVEGELPSSRQLLGVVDEAGSAPTQTETIVKQSVQLEQSAEELEQMVYVVQGVAKWAVGGREMVVRTGDVLHIPSGVSHQAEAMDDTFQIAVLSDTASRLGRRDSTQ